MEKDVKNIVRFQVELTANHSEIAKNGLRRLWGVPDTSAYVGHLFRMEIPKQAFSGDVLAYKVRPLFFSNHSTSFIRIFFLHFYKIFAGCVLQNLEIFFYRTHKI